jgi:Protein of unknown function (DUF2971)
MVQEAWIARERVTLRYTAPTGELIQIRSIDPEFSSEDGNIETGRYVREHDEYLRQLRKDGGVVYHYTSLEALHGIVKQGALWASDASHLNDRAELRYALENMRHLMSGSRHQSSNQQPLDAIFRPGLARQYVACFSKARDQLSQWRAYGRQIGVSIAFDRSHLDSALRVQRGEIFDCRYLKSQEFSILREDLEIILQALSQPGALNEKGELINIAVQNELTQKVIKIATYIKHPSFAEEQEVRLAFPSDQAFESIRFRSSHQSLVPFLEIDVDGRRIGMKSRRRYANNLGMLEIIVWPNDVGDEILDAIGLLLWDAGQVVIGRSQSPYRT